MYSVYNKLNYCSKWYDGPEKKKHLQTKGVGFGGKPKLVLYTVYTMHYTHVSHLYCPRVWPSKSFYNIHTKYYNTVEWWNETPLCIL